MEPSRLLNLMCTAGLQWRELYWIVTGAVYAPRPVPGYAGAVRTVLFYGTVGGTGSAEPLYVPPNALPDRWNRIGGTALRSALRAVGVTQFHLYLSRRPSCTAR